MITCPLTTDDSGDSTGSTRDDKFVALEDALTQYIVDGGDGEDTLVATISASDNYNVSNVEAITFKVTAAATIDMDDFSDETSVTVKSSGNTTLENFDASVALTSEQTGTAVLTVTLDDDSGSADELDLTLDDATTTGNYVLAGIETIALTSSGSENVIDLDAESATTLDISGSADIDVEILANTASLETIDASAATGDVSIDADAVALDLDVTTGSGDDDLLMGLFLDDSDVIDMGDGEDTLEVTASTSIIDAETDITNVETLSITSVTTTDALDASIVSFDNIVYTSTADADEFTITGVTTESITITAEAEGIDLAEVNISLDDATGESDTATLIIENSAEDGADFEVTLIASAEGGIETLALDLVQGSDVEGSDITVAGITTGDFTTLEISGDADATIGSTTIETIDASEATGDLTITLGTADHDVTGGSGDDTFAFVATMDSDDTVDGGDGEDTLSATPAAGTARPTTTAVEIYSLTFDTASATVSLADSEGVAELELLGDESLVVSGIQSTTTAIRLGSTTAANTDTATFTYAAADAEEDVTITVGDADAEDDVDQGTVTVSTFAGDLTINSDGEDGNSIANLVAAKVDSLTITSETNFTVTGDVTVVVATTVALASDGGTLTIGDDIIADDATTITIAAEDGDVTVTGDITVSAEADLAITLTADENDLIIDGVIDAESAYEVNLTAANGGTIRVDGIVLSGEDSSGEDVDVELTLTTDDNSSTIDFTIGATIAAATEIDLVTIVSGDDGDGETIEVTFTNANTNLTITEIDASAAEGDLVITLTTSDDAVEITTGGGDATIIGSTAADTITLGSGDNSVDTQGGADIITAGEGADTIILSDVDDIVELSNFDVESDFITIDLSVFLAPITGNDVAIDTYFNPIIQSAVGGAAFTLASTTSILRLTGTYANVAAVDVALETFMTTGANPDDGDLILVLWTDGSDSYLSSTELNDLTASNTITDTITDTAAVQLVGIAVGDLNAANFNFQA